MKPPALPVKPARSKDALIDGVMWHFKLFLALFFTTITAVIVIRHGLSGGTKVEIEAFLRQWRIARQFDTLDDLAWRLTLLPFAVMLAVWKMGDGDSDGDGGDGGGD